MRVVYCCILMPGIALAHNTCVMNARGMRMQRDTWAEMGWGGGSQDRGQWGASGSGGQFEKVTWIIQAQYEMDR